MKPVHNLERRDKARLPYVCPISVKDLRSGESCSARMFNYSDTGIYFESDAFLESGSEVLYRSSSLPIRRPAQRLYLLSLDHHVAQGAAGRLAFLLRLRHPDFLAERPCKSDVPPEAAPIPPQALQSTSPVCGRPHDRGGPRRRYQPFRSFRQVRQEASRRAEHCLEDTR